MSDLKLAAINFFVILPCSLILALGIPLSVFGDPPPVDRDDIPNVFCFRITDVGEDVNDPEGDRFLISFEILNWTNQEAFGLYLATNSATQGKDPQSAPHIAEAFVDINGRPLGSGNDDANFQPRDGTSGTKIGRDNDWQVEQPSPTSVLFTALNRGRGQGLGARPILSATCRVFPCMFRDGKVVVDNAEIIDNAPFDEFGGSGGRDNVLDGFVLILDDFDRGDVLSLNWFFLGDDDQPIGVTAFGDPYGFGTFNLFRGTGPAKALWERSQADPQGSGTNIGGSDRLRDMFVSVTPGGEKFKTEFAGAMTAPFTNAADNRFGAPINAMEADANVIQNPSFTCDLSSWNGNAGLWNSEDSVGAIESGSLRIEESSAESETRTQCVPVLPDTEYQLGHRYFIPGGQPQAPTAQLSLSWHGGTKCADSLGQGNIHSGNSVGEWASSPIIMTTAPVDAGSAEITLQTVAQGPALPVESFFDDILLAPASECQTFGPVLCLNDGRFRVTVDFRTQFGTGQGQAQLLTTDGGTLWFFDNTNPELTVKVLDACGAPFNRFWVFIAGVTNVEVDILVVDTQSGQERRYSNPLGVPFEPILDVNAFATCP